MEFLRTPAFYRKLVEERGGRGGGEEKEKEISQKQLNKRKQNDR